MSVADDILQLIDKTSGVGVTYRETTTWYDGTPMDDSKRDPTVFVKKDGIFYKRTFDELDSKNLIKDNMQALRDLAPYEILMLKMGVYESVEVQGYLTKGDIPKPVVFKIANPTTNTEGFEVVDVLDIKLVSEFTVTKQSTLPLADTSWRVVYDVTCPERGDTNLDTSTLEFRDYVNIKGTINVHELQEPLTIRVNTDRPSYGQRPLKSVKFNFIVAGWREFYKIDEAYLHLSEPPQPLVGSLDRDLIRVVKVSRLRYQLQVRQDYQNSVVIPTTDYERKSTGSVINYLKDALNTIVSPNVVKNSYNYDQWSESISWLNVYDKPEGKAVFPIKNDQKLNIALQEIPDTTPVITRTGVYRETNYATPLTFGWGTRTTGETDGITAETIPNSTRQFLRFRLRPGQVNVPQRSELSTVSPVTPIQGVTNVRWFSGMLRLPETLKVAKGNSFIVIQMLPEDTPVGREPCVALYVRDGHLVLESRNNTRGTTGDLSGDGGINVRPTIKYKKWDLGPVNLGSWDKIIIKAEFSWTNSGKLQLWRNDELLVDSTGPNCWYDPGKNTPFVKFGIYNPLWSSTADDNLDSSYNIQVDWCDPMWGGYEATYLSMTPYNVTNYRGLRINVDADLVNSKSYQQNGAVIATYPAVPSLQTVDVATIITTGNYGINAASTNLPIASSGNLMVFRCSNGTIVHIFVPNTGAQFYFNTRSGGVWVGWRNLLANATPSLRGLVNQTVQVPKVIADDAVQSTVADATDLPTAIALVNDLKTKYNSLVILANSNKRQLNAKLDGDVASNQQVT